MCEGEEVMEVKRGKGRGRGLRGREWLSAGEWVSREEVGGRVERVGKEGKV